MHDQGGYYTSTKDEEIKVADKCRADLKKNSDDTEAGTETKEELETTEADLSNTIANLNDEIKNSGMLSSVLL